MTSSPEKFNAAVHAAIDPPILPEGTQVIRDNGWYQVINPGLKEASSNEVMLSHLADSDVDRRVEGAMSLYRQHGLPFKWAIGPMSSPERIEKKIAPRASTSWEFRGMGIDTGTELPGSDRVTVEPVTPKNFDAFLEVNLSGWELGAFRDQTRRKLTKMMAHPRYRCFVAFKDGIAIGTASTVLKNGYGYLIGAVVLDQHRGCGAYKTLIQARLADLRAMDIDFAVTQARAATSAPILERLGFGNLYTARIYRFDFQLT